MRRIGRTCSCAGKLVAATGKLVAAADALPPPRPWQLERFNLPTPEAIFELGYFKRNPLPFHLLAKARGAVGSPPHGWPPKIRHKGNRPRSAALVRIALRPATRAPLRAPGAPLPRRRLPPQELFPGNYVPTPAHMFMRLLHDKGLLLRVCERRRAWRGPGVPARLTAPTAAGQRVRRAAALCDLLRGVPDPDRRPDASWAPLPPSSRCAAPPHHPADTQNIDCLEREAGLPHDKVVAAHGNFDAAHCIDCGREHSQDHVKQARPLPIWGYIPTEGQRGDEMVDAVGCRKLREHGCPAYRGSQISTPNPAPTQAVFADDVCRCVKCG